MENNFCVQGQGVYYNDVLIEYCATKDQAYQLCSLLALVLRTSSKDIKGPFIVDDSDYPAYLIYAKDGTQVRILEGESKPLQGLCSMLNLVVKQTRRHEGCLYTPKSIVRDPAEIEDLITKLKPGRFIPSSAFERGVMGILNWLTDEDYRSPVK